MTSTEQWNFVHSLITFPGLGQDNSFYCPCSEEMKSWHDKLNGDDGAIPTSCTGWFSTLKALEVHCGRKNDDSWHDVLNTFLEFRETSESEDEDDNDSTAESVQGDEEKDHNDDEGTNGDSQEFSGNDDSENRDNNESAEELAQGEKEGGHNADEARAEDASYEREGEEEELILQVHRV